MQLFVESIQLFTFMRRTKYIAGVLGLWMVFILNVLAQQVNFVTATNIVMVTNFVKTAAVLQKRMVGNTTTNKIVVVAKYPWQGTITAGATLTCGNCDSLLLNVKFMSNKNCLKRIRTIFSTPPFQDLLGCWSDEVVGTGNLPRVSE